MDNECDLVEVVQDCLEATIDATKQESITKKLVSLPAQHVFVLLAACSWTNHGTREIVQQVTTDQVQDGDANIMGEALLGA